MPIEAVLFDWGGVLTKSPFEAFSALGDGFGMSRERVVELVFGPYHEDTDHAWHRLERGEITLKDWVAHLQSELEAEGVEFDLGSLASVFSALTPNEEVVEKARALRADGYRTALVTNNIAEGSAAWRSLIPLDELFEVVVDSSAVGMRKPDPRIFHLTLEQLGGIDPGRAVLLDDAPGNVAGAQRAGLHAILVGPEPALALAELDALLAGAT
jgi:epoxide hydrolase-like predicted phosphatase